MNDSIIKGQFNEAKILQKFRRRSYKQIKELCNQEFVKEAKFDNADAHTGVGCNRNNNDYKR